VAACCHRAVAVEAAWSRRQVLEVASSAVDAAALRTSCRHHRLVGVRRPE